MRKTARDIYKRISTSILIGIIVAFCALASKWLQNLVGLPPTLYYNGKTSVEWYEDSDGNYLDLTTLETVGEISRSCKFPKKEGECNLIVSAGQPIYRVYREGEEWLLVEVKYSDEDGKLMYHGQVYFRFE